MTTYLKQLLPTVRAYWNNEPDFEMNLEIPGELKSAFLQEGGKDIVPFSGTGRYYLWHAEPSKTLKICFSLPAPPEVYSRKVPTFVLHTPKDVVVGSLNPLLGVDCVCGSDRAYGVGAAPHSSWCPRSHNG